MRTLTLSKSGYNKIRSHHKELKAADVESSLKPIPPGEWCFLSYQMENWVCFVNSMVEDKFSSVHILSEISEKTMTTFSPKKFIEEKIKNTDPSLLFSRSYEAERLLDNIPKGGLATPKFEITPYENRIIIPKLGKNIPLLDVYHDLDANYIEMHKIFMEELRK